MHPQLKWLAKHRTCPNCWSEDVTYEANDQTELTCFWCNYCDWKLTSVQYRHLMLTNLKAILVDELNIVLLNEEGEVIKNETISRRRTDNLVVDNE